MTEWTRRDTLRLLGVGTVAAGLATSGCSVFAGTPEPRLLPSTAPLPKPYVVPLPIPPIAKPVSSTGSADVYDMTVREGEAEILPGLRTPVLGYDGIFPGPTFEARSGRRVVLRQRNQLGHPVVTHLHGGLTPPDSDGYPIDLVRPGDSRTYEFPLEQRAATLWYHDHRMDFTGPQVWRGLAGLFLVRDDEEDALPLPGGARDIPLLICDRSFAEDGRLRYPSLDPGLREPPGVKDDFLGGVLGDVVLVNGAPWPRLDVARTRYRFRLLNASNARTYDLALSPAGGIDAPFVQIGSDGGLLAAPRRRRTVRLAPAERADVVIDFSGYKVGEQVTLTNTLADGSAARVMRFHVDRAEHDDSHVPARLSTIERLDPARATRTREFDFSSGEVHGHDGWTINGKPFDPDRMDARPKLGSTEIWRLTTDVAHPIHLHLVQFQVLSIDGERPVGEPAWKDTLDLKPAQTAEIIARFDGYRGRYVFHCHNLEHEDMAMMANFEVV